MFEGLRGLVLGRPYAYDEEKVKEWEEMIVDQLYGLDVPVVSRVDIGHTDPMVTLPMGARCVLDSEDGRFEVLEAGVKGEQEN